MFIHEAVSLALEKGTCIGRTEWRGSFKIKPDLRRNGFGAAAFNSITVIGKDEACTGRANKFRKWIANPLDILANDWILIS